MMRRAALLALLSLPALGAAAQPEGINQLDYIGILYDDRAQLQLQVDKLRLEAKKLERERDAAAQRAVDVDDYWKRWTGVK